MLNEIRMFLAELTGDAKPQAHFAENDYRLAAALLGSEHALRDSRSLEESAEALRTQLKHAPRRDEEARLVVVEEAPDAVVVQATGTQTTVERTGRRLRQDVIELYRLTRHNDVWRIAGQV